MNESDEPFDPLRGASTLLPVPVGEHLRLALGSVISLTLLTGCVFPLVLFALGRLLFPIQAGARTPRAAGGGKIMITVRQASAKDVITIRNIFLACYGTDYSPRYYDEYQLTRLVYSDDSLFLVAEDTESGEIVGTASVDLEVGARSDLVAEFGRLAVDPAFRHRGVGNLLMRSRKLLHPPKT